MGEILETCEQLLLKGKGSSWRKWDQRVYLSLSGDLPHDAIVSAAMLMVVASNILNSASKESYAEYINGWLTRERWMPFPKLAVCHALLAKIPSSLLLAVSLGREEPLILDLFPMLCQLFDG